MSMECQCFSQKLPPKLVFLWTFMRNLQSIVYLFLGSLFFVGLPSGLKAQNLEDDLKALVTSQASRINAIEQRLNSLEQSEIVCLAGKKVTGAINRWSPVSSCPESYAAMGIERLDLEGSHDIPNLHVNDLWCDQKGCRAWCIGTTCTVITKCCRWQPKTVGTTK